ncbi:MFS transporter [Candidatus Micrarchaeota archaeon]|nr:MFS transporter [Candidatus Micrarchaeota archaeon]
MANTGNGNPFIRLIIVYSLWTIGGALAGSLFEVYFYSIGMPLQEIYLADAFWFVAALLMVPVFRRFRARDFMLAGICMAAVSVSLLYTFQGEWTAAAFRLLLGTTHVLFWAPFNILFYEFRKDNHATLGAIYYSVGPVISLVTPAFAGILAATLGFQTLYLLAIASFAMAFAAAALLVGNREYRYDFDSAMKSITGLRSLIFMEGFGAAVIVSVSLPTMLLLYVSRPEEFGIFTSLVTIFAVVATLITAKLSDRLKKRRSFLLPVAACFGVSAIFAGFAPTLSLFFVGFGLVNFFSRIFFPLPLALAVDNSKSLANTMVGREYMLNLGRLSGTLFGFLIIAYSDIRTALIIQGAILLIYVPLFERKKKKLQSN